MKVYVNRNRFGSVSRAMDFSRGGEVVSLILKAGLTLGVLKKREIKVLRPLPRKWLRDLHQAWMMT